MKQSQITLIVVGFILVALMASNPSTEEHKEAVKEKMSSAFENDNSDGNEFKKLGEQIGQTIGMAIIDKMIKRENYLLFSLTKSTYFHNEKTKIVGLGIFGKVYLSNEFTENISKKIEESSNPIIGNTIKIENIEVAEKDFPKTMNWDDAKKACESLGNGWRLPNKNELNTLYQNKDKIGGFTNTSLCVYWSGTKEENTSPWGQYFVDGTQSYYEGYSLYVRAVRTIK